MNVFALTITTGICLIPAGADSFAFLPGRSSRSLAGAYPTPPGPHPVAPGTHRGGTGLGGTGNRSSAPILFGVSPNKSGPAPPCANSPDAPLQSRSAPLASTGAASLAGGPGMAGRCHPQATTAGRPTFQETFSTRKRTAARAGHPPLTPTFRPAMAGQRCSAALPIAAGGRLLPGPAAGGPTAPSHYGYSLAAPTFRLRPLSSCAAASSRLPPTPY